MRRVLLGGSLIAIALVAAPLSGATVAASSGVVASVYDGDTLSLTMGARVRLLQLDTPELGSGECYSRAARKALLKLVPIGSRVTLEADARLDDVDRYGRLLRYVHRGPLNANITLVRVGAAAPYFYGGDDGKYAFELVSGAQKAKAAQARPVGSVPRDRPRSVPSGRHRYQRPAHQEPGAERQVRSQLRRRVRSAVSTRPRLRRSPGNGPRADQEHRQRPARPRR